MLESYTPSQQETPSHRLIFHFKCLASDFCSGDDFKWHLKNCNFLPSSMQRELRMRKVQQSNLNFYVLTRSSCYLLDLKLFNPFNNFSLFCSPCRKSSKNGRHTKDIIFPDSFTSLPTQICERHTSDR